MVFGGKNRPLYDSQKFGVNVTLPITRGSSVAAPHSPRTIRCQTAMASRPASWENDRRQSFV